MIRKTIFALAFVTLTSVTALACDMPEGWVSMKSDAPGDIVVLAKIPVEPIQVATPFDIDIKVCGTDADDIVFDAIMPAHQHGMNYVPSTQALEAGHYKGTGMFFHMPGNWQISAVLKDGETHRFFLDVIAK